MDGQRVAGLQQVAGHRLTHVAETDEADLHDEILLLVPAAGYRPERQRGNVGGALGTSFRVEVPCERVRNPLLIYMNTDYLHDVVKLSVVDKSPS